MLCGVISLYSSRREVWLYFRTSKFSNPTPGDIFHISPGSVTNLKFQFLFNADFVSQAESADNSGHSQSFPEEVL